jgi:hypothetical protein
MEIKALQPLDVLLALKLALVRGQEPSIRGLGDSLEVPKSTLDLSLRRLRAHGLLRGEPESLNRLSLRDLVQHGIRWVAPAKVGKFVLGIPTAASAPVMKAELLGQTDEVVIPVSEGPSRGREVSALHPSAAAAALRDPHLYELLSLVDVFRIGTAREKSVALPLLQARI